MKLDDSYFRLDLLDYSFFKICGNKALLKPFMTFKVPGAHFSKAYKDKKWDGTVKLNKWNKLPVGLLPYFIMEGTRRGLKLEAFLNNNILTPKDLEDGLFTGPKWDASSFIELIDHLPDKIKVRYYQIEALNELLKTSRGLLVLPTGSGKSLSMYMLNHMLRTRLKMGVLLVPRSDLVSQLEMNFLLFSGGNLHMVTSERYGRDIFSHLDPEGPNLIISTWQSWMSWRSDNIIPIVPDYFIGDEAHTFGKNNTPWEYMAEFRDVRYRYGLTATNCEHLHERYALEGLFGPIVYEEKPEKLIEDGYLARPNITRIYFEHSLPARIPGAPKLNQRDLVRRPERMRAISNLVDERLPQDKSLMILTEAVEEEINPLHYILTASLPDTLVLKLDRNSSAKERKEAIDLVNKPRQRTILLVTYGLFQMGIDIPELSYLMLASQSKSPIRVLQSIGRALRPDSPCFVWDLIDYSDEKIDRISAVRLGIYKAAYGKMLTIKDEFITL